MILEFMDKKDFLIRVLIQLEPIWNLAKWLKFLVEEWKFWDDVLDVLINAVQWAVSTAKFEKDKNKLKKWLNALEKLKQMEVEKKTQDEKDLNELENMIDNL